MRSEKCHAGLTTGIAALVLTVSLASAQASDSSAPSSGDLAASFIDFLFGGGSPPFSNESLSIVADALRQAMSVYGFSMLAVAGIVLFYHIASMIVETAHHGVVMGKRANQVWAPIRLVVAVALLIPVSGGLSSGQHIVLAIATSGSNMASRAWSHVAPALSGSFLNLVAPWNPDVSKFVINSVNMEICRDVYDRMQSAQTMDSGARLAGIMGGLQKLPAAGFAPETWRYTNPFNASYPMCGEYRFAGYRPRVANHGEYRGEMARVAEDIGAFSRAEADYVLTQARGVASFVAPAFADAGRIDPIDISGSVTSLIQAVQKHLYTHQQTLTTTQAAFASQYVSQANSSGWVTAAFFMPDLVWLQESYGELIDGVLPYAQEPVFSHRMLTQQSLSEAAEAGQMLRGAVGEVGDNISRFYAKVAAVNSVARKWLLNSQTEAAYYNPGSDLDLREHINAATDTSAAFSALARAVDSSALSHGVWGYGLLTEDAGNPLVPSFLSNARNPLASLIEFGRRQFNMGAHVSSLAGGSMSAAGAFAPATLVALLGGAFSIGGIALIFLVPLLPFARFALAILAWLVELAEALVSVPWVAIAHISPEGGGLSGGAARKSYLLWLSLGIRPIMSVFGLAAGILIFALGIFVLLLTFAPVAQISSASNNVVMIVANTGLVLTFDVMACIMANAAFKGINAFPQHVLDWLSPFVMTESPAQDNSPSPAVGSSSYSTGTQLASLSSSRTSSYSESSGTSSKQGRSAPNGGAMSQSSLFPTSVKERKDFQQKEAGNRETATIYQEKTVESSLTHEASAVPDKGSAAPSTAPQQPEQAGAAANPFAQSGFFADSDPTHKV